MTRAGIVHVCLASIPSRYGRLDRAQPLRDRPARPPRHRRAASRARPTDARYERPASAPRCGPSRPGRPAGPQPMTTAASGQARRLGARAEAGRRPQLAQAVGGLHGLRRGGPRPTRPRRRSRLSRRLQVSSKIRRSLRAGSDQALATRPSVGHAAGRSRSPIAHSGRMLVLIRTSRSMSSGCRCAQCVATMPPSDIASRR